MPERAAQRVFEDGLVIPDEHLYYTPDPLNLERDAGWLASATAHRAKVEPGFTVDQAFVDRLAIISEAGTAITLKRLNKKSPALVVQLARQACQDFVDELGWSAIPSLYEGLRDTAPPAMRALDVLMPPTDCVFRNMRTLYAYLGNSVMELVADHPRLLRRIPIQLAVLTEELEGFRVDVSRQLRVHPELFATANESRSAFSLHALLKAANVKPADRPPVRRRTAVPKTPEQQAARKATAGAKRKSQPRKPSRAREEQPEATEDFTVVVPKAQDRFEHLDAMFNAAAAERQAAIRELLPYLNASGGIHALLQVCPRILDCTGEILAAIAEQAKACEDEDGLSLRKVASILNQAS